MSTPTREHIIARIRSYLDRTGSSARHLAVEATGAHKSIGRIEAGLPVSLGVVERLEAYMAANPDGVVRTVGRSRAAWTPTGRPVGRPRKSTTETETP